MCLMHRLKKEFYEATCARLFEHVAIELADVFPQTVAGHLDLGQAQVQADVFAHVQDVEIFPQTDEKPIEELNSVFTRKRDENLLQ